MNDEVLANRPEPATEVTFPPLAFANATGIFILMGATSSIFGPLLVSFTRHFNLSLPSAGAVLSVYFVGASLGVLPGWLGLKHLEGRRVLVFATLTFSIGAAGAAAARSWPLFLASVFCLGLGLGGLDIGLNTLLPRTSLEGRAHRLSVANAGYGVGAVICPIIIVLVHPENFRLIFAGIAVVALFLSLSNGGVEARPLRAEERQQRISAMKSRRRPMLVTFVAAYIFYVAVETGAAGWMATQLHGEGFSQSMGSFVTAGFWGGLALGRMLGGPLYHRLSDKKLVLGGLALATMFCCLASFRVLAPYVYPVLGLLIASVFPMGLMWYSTLCPHDSDGISWLILFMMVGGVGGPGVISLMVSMVGVHAVPLTIASFAAVDLAIFLSALRFKPLVLA